MKVSLTKYIVRILDVYRALEFPSSCSLLGLVSSRRRCSVGEVSKEGKGLLGKNMLIQAIKFNIRTANTVGRKVNE